jgi:integrase-like protein
VHLAGCTPTPNGPWVTQQARHLMWTLAERPEPVRFLIRDRDQKFTEHFDEVFQSDGIAIVRTPFRAPQANGVAERFVRTVRSECLDWVLILNQQHLKGVLDVFVEHYKGHRPHRALGLNAPKSTRAPVATACAEARVGASRSSRRCCSRVCLGRMTRFLHLTRLGRRRSSPDYPRSSPSPCVWRIANSLSILEFAMHRPLLSGHQ